jgi:hypothetical protein
MATEKELLKPIRGILTTQNERDRPSVNVQALFHISLAVLALVWPRGKPERRSTRRLAKLQPGLIAAKARERMYRSR